MSSMKIAPNLSNSLLSAHAAHAMRHLRTDAQKTSTATPTPDVSAPSTASGTPELSVPPTLDLEAFFAAWGSADPRFDVTSDGVVDGFDLGVLLGESESVSGAQNAPADPNPPTAIPTQQEVLDQWGSAGSADANGDGIVDAQDLALALGNAQPQPGAELIAGIQGAWGTSDSSYDLNQDGTVDAQDLAIALGGGTVAAPTPDSANAATTVADTGATQQTVEQVADALVATRDADSDGALTAAELPSTASRSDIDGDRDGRVTRDEIVSRVMADLDRALARNPSADVGAILGKWLDSLAGRTYRDQAHSDVDRAHRALSATGFGSRPPENLSDLVSKLAPNKADRVRLLKGLAAKYPNGLGITPKA